MSMLKFLERNNPLFRDFFEIFDTDHEGRTGSGWPWDLRSRPLGTFPGLNVEEDDDTVRVQVLAPGVKKEDFNVNIKGNVLIVEGRRPDPCEGRDCTPYRQERFSGAFQRVITLPDTIESDRSEARYENGVLAIAFEKSDRRKMKKITVGG